MSKHSTPNANTSASEAPAHCAQCSQPQGATACGDRLLSIPEAAELLGTSTRMPRRLVVERRVPVVKVGRHVRFWESDLLAYLAAQTIPARTAGHLSAPGTARDTKGIARAVRAR